MPSGSTSPDYKLEAAEAFAQAGTRNERWRAIHQVLRQLEPGC